MLNVIKAIRQRALNAPTAPAVINGPRTMAYGDLLNLVARLSNHFIDRGIAPGSRFFFNIVDPDLRLIAGLACLHSGMTPFLVGEPGELEHGKDFQFILGSVPLSFPTLTPDLWIDDSVFAGKRSDGQLREFPDRGIDDVLFFAGTSGTTGRRKVVVERRGSFELKHQRSDSSRMSATDRVLVTFGDSSKYGFTFGLKILAHQATLVRSSPTAEAMLANINLHHVTQLRTTPATLEKLVAGMEQTGRRAPSLKHIVLTGSLFPKSLIERTTRVSKASLAVSYGSSEVSGVAHGQIIPEKFEVGYVGELRAGTKLIAPGTREAPAPIVLAGRPEFFTEYYQDGKITKSHLENFRLPDIGYMRGKSLFLVGRDDEVLNLSGNKIAFSAIEKALRDISGLPHADVGIATIPPDWEIGGIVVAYTGSPQSGQQLAERVSAAIGHPGAAQELHFLQLPAIPRNDLGKVDRQALIGAFQKSRRVSA